MPSKRDLELAALGMTIRHMRQTRNLTIEASPTTPGCPLGTSAESPWHPLSTCP